MTWPFGGNGLSVLLLDSRGAAMDMNVDSSYIKAQREQRAWSQEHLAEVTGLGLRTIQRIETAGSASYESARALAAVFGVDVATLRARAGGGPRLSIPLRPFLCVLAALAASATLFVATRSFADQVLLDVGIKRSAAIPGSTGVDTREWFTQVVVDDGTWVPEVNDMRLEELRFTIVPKLLPDGPILIEMQIFEREGDGEVLVSAPRHVVADGQKVEVVTGDEARSFRFTITPRRRPRPL
jgi:transcriptional regulator with XRE-family HTH domain